MYMADDPVSDILASSVGVSAAMLRARLRSAGYVIVPIEPSEAMSLAGDAEHEKHYLGDGMYSTSMDDVWRAMVKASDG